MVMKANELVDLIISFSWEGKVLLDDLIINISFELITDAAIREYVIDNYADPKKRNFIKLRKEINSINDFNSGFQKILIHSEIDGVYVERIKSSVYENITYKHVIKFLNNINAESNKGIVYEEFCKLFLEDLGIKCSKTTVTNDKGIDIVGSFKVKLSEEIGELVFNEDIYLLVQTKYFNKKIDTPVIRKLVGDSLFIRFDELEYLEIKHNAFHLIVFSHKGYTEPAIRFAKKNKIKLFDSTRIAHIISEQPNKTWKCLERCDL